MPAPHLILHVLPPSHPCMTVEAALRLKGLAYEKISLTPGPHVEEMQRLYGDGHRTVPGLMVGDEPVHGSRLFDDLARLPALLAHVDSLILDGLIGGERPLLEGRPLEAVARRWFPEYAGEIPAGAFPAGWVPSSS